MKGRVEKEMKKVGVWVREPTFAKAMVDEMRKK